MTRFGKNERRFKYGIFNKKGWKVIMLVDSREEGERIINAKGEYSQKFYEVRELDWGEENVESTRDSKKRK